METIRTLHRQFQRMLSAPKLQRASHPEGLGPKTKRAGSLGPDLKLPFEILVIIVEFSCDDTLAKWAVTNGLLTEPAQRVLYHHLNEQSFQRMHRCILARRTVALHANKGCGDEAAPYRRRALYVRHISLRDYDCNLAAWMIQGIGPGAFTGLRSFALPLWTSSRELWGNHMPAPVPLQGIEVVRLFSSVPILRICVNSRPINSTSFSDWTAAAPTEVHVAFARPRLDQQSLPMTFLPDLLGFQPALERLVIITARGDDNQRSFRTRVAPATYARDLCSLLRPLLTDSDVSVGRHTSGMNQRYRLAPICRLSPKSSFRSPITSRDYSRRVLGSQLPSIGALLTTRYQCRWRELSFSSIWSNRSCRRADEASASVLSLPIAADFSRTTTDSSEDVDSIDNAGSGFPNEY